MASKGKGSKKTPATTMTAAEVLTWLKRKGTRRNIEGMARYGIVARHPIGVSMGTMLPLAKKLRPNHALALSLWESGWFEARMLATMVDDPSLVTKRQMNSWARDFENWADCDTACFKLFDQSPHAWQKAREWSASPREFVRRGGFALMASLALHDKAAPHAQFLAFLPLIETGARDERNFVKKGVSWALRGIGRRDAALHAPTVAVARRLAASPNAAARWVGRDALRDLTSPAMVRRLAKRRRD